MGLESVDFQSLVHRQVTQLMEFWQAAGIPPEGVQEAASHLFNMGLIAGQQVQQEGGIQPEGAAQKIPYTAEMAERIIGIFLQGLSTAVVKMHEERLPGEEKWKLMQNVAYHVFEQSKQVIIATLGQEHTPGVQISDEQIHHWIGQTAVEALFYYISEYEKQFGPLTRTNLPEPDSNNDTQAEEPRELLPEAPSPQEPVRAESSDSHSQQAAPATLPESYHKFAAVGLLLSSLPHSKQQRILAAFTPEEQQIIGRYRDPEVVASELHLGRVAAYLKQFKEKMGQGRSSSGSQYASSIARAVAALPVHRLDRLFRNERPLLRSYVNQFVQNPEPDSEVFSMPAGVEESLLLYLRRNFPEEMASL